MLRKRALKWGALLTGTTFAGLSLLPGCDGLDQIVNDLLSVIGIGS
jgi:hypothetical protein